MAHYRMSTPSPSTPTADNPYSPWRTVNLKVLIPLVYALPLLVLYLLVVVVILSRLRGPFYRLFAVAGITVRIKSTFFFFFFFFRKVTRKNFD